MTLPLQGIRVLELARTVAGPFCSMTLADMGAEVIKIEEPGRGDDVRYLAPQVDGVSSVFALVNRNKRSVTLDLRLEESQCVLHELVKSCDIVAENFSTGVVDKYNLSYEVLSSINPRLIYCSVSGYGRQGEFARRPGFDPVVQADAGLFSINGAADGPPTRIAAPIVDVGSGMSALNAILAALYTREKTGRGQYVEVALFDVAVALSSYFAMNYLMTGSSPNRLGNDSSTSQPVGLFSASNGTFYLSCSNDRSFRKLAACIDAPALVDDPRFATNADRCANGDALREELAAIFNTMDCDTIVGEMLTAGVPVGRTFTIGEALESPVARSRGTVSNAVRANGRPVPNVKAPFDLHGTPLLAPKACPELGEANQWFLDEILGCDEARAAELAAAGVFGQ
ncbi:MAG: CoA transferase [Gammaproteobacteria bacterium]|nr:CoA transferase [Gammaproteobacteria bacterium]